MTCTRLERMGYKVIEASGSLEAIRLFDDNAKSIDLLLTDVVMPNMNGRMLAEKLREHRQDLPVLFISGYTDDQLLRQGILDTNEVIVTKPFTIGTLVSQIRKVLAVRTKVRRHSTKADRKND